MTEIITTALVLPVTLIGAASLIRLIGACHDAQVQEAQVRERIAQQSLTRTDNK